jgi:hypothetical protein
MQSFANSTIPVAEPHQDSPKPPANRRERRQYFEDGGSGFKMVVAASPPG